MRAPDYADALIGWRVWCVVETGEGARLASVIHDRVWPPHTELLATCERGHAAPAMGCSCGVHAARDPATVLTYLHGRNDPWVAGRVLGRVLLWGTVVEHEYGWRASRAYPLELVTGDPALARSLAAYA